MLPRSNWPHLSTKAGENWPRPQIVDPNTQLLSFCTLSRHIDGVFRNALKTNQGIGIAIGDVDGLKEYVEDVRSEDPMLFGHLAGNALMRDCGDIVLDWYVQEVGRLEFGASDYACVATFGGDEVIYIQTTSNPEEFLKSSELLDATVSRDLNLPMTFSAAWFHSDVSNCEVEGASLTELAKMALLHVEKGLFGSKFARKRGTGTSLNWLGTCTLNIRDQLWDTQSDD